MKRVLLLLALVACSSKSPSTEAPPPLMPTPTEGSAAGSATQGPPSTDPMADKNPGMGETCGENDACAKGFECIKYYGIAGARGPEFKTCEVRCEPKTEATVCPKGTRCATIADGPGQVCR